MRGTIRKAGAPVCVVRTGVLAALLWVAALSALFAQTSQSFTEGERLFLNNRPREAAALLERATRETPSNEKAWLYLGICYQQLGQYEDAIAALRKGLPAAATLAHVFHFNMGNSYFLMGKNAFAEEMYSQAIASKPDWPPPLLNRANARMAQGNYKEAVADYTVYLSLNPASPQAESIRRVIAMIGQAEEAEAAKLAEQEARRIAEEEAKQAMLDAVAESLRESAEATTSMSAGSGEVQGYTEDFTLED